MEIKTKELQAKLTKINPGLYSRGIIDQADHFLFTGELLVSYNDRFSIAVPFRVEEPFSVPGKEFLKVINGIDQDEFVLEYDPQFIVITAEGTRSGIARSQGTLIQDVQHMFGRKRWTRLPEGFQEAVFLCMFTISPDVSRGWMSNLVISGKYVFSSDDLRISRYQLPSAIRDSFLLPRSSAIELSKLTPMEYCLQEGWVYFQEKDKTIFASRIIADDAPREVEEFFKEEGHRINLPKKLKSLIESVTIFAEGELDLDKKITILLERNKITCKGRKEIGWIEKVMEFKYTGRKIEFQTNPFFLNQVLDKSTDVFLGGQAAVFESGNFKHVMCLPA